MRIFLILSLVLPFALCGTDIARLSNRNALNEWQARKGAKLEASKWPDNNPGFCGKLTFEKYRPGGDQWPAIDLPVSSLGTTDWSFLKELHVTIYAMENGFLRLFVAGTNAEGKQIAVRYNIPLEAGRNSVVIGRDVFAALPLGRITAFNYFLTRPESGKTFYIGDMAGIFENPREHLQRFLRQAEAIKSADFSGLNPEMRKKATDTVTELDALCRKLKQEKKMDGSMLAQVKSGLALIRTLEEYRQLSGLMRFKRNPALAAGWIPSTEKVFRDDQLFSSEPVETGKLALAGNEREGMQLVVYPLRELKNVRVEAGAIPELPGASVSIHPVGYVLCKKPSYPVERTGWMPDPICEYADTMNLDPEKYQAYYLEVKLPPGSPAGTYRGEVRLSADGIAPVALPFEVRVFGFSLPDGVPYPLATSEGATTLGKNYPATPEGQAEYREKCRNMLLDYRISPDSLYRTTPPTVEEAQTILKNRNSKFNIIFVPSHNDASGHYPEPDRSRILNELARVVPEYRKAGILDRAYLYGFDEAGPEKFAAMRDILGEIKKTYPEIPIMTTAYDNSYGVDSGLDSCVDIWVPLTDKVPLTRHAIAEARKRGKEVWWYICIAPTAPYANLMIEYPAIDGRLLMGMMSLKYRPQGFLYYCVSMWRKYWKDDKGAWQVSMRETYMKGAPLTDWAGYSWRDSNGDGNWTYPAKEGPIPSLRLKNVTDGLEDFFYWQMLRDAVESARNHTATVPPDWLPRAEKALQAPDRIVESLTQYQTDFDLLRKERREVGELLEIFYKHR